MNYTQGFIAGAVVPGVTYRNLTLKDGYDNSRQNLGKYANGFWFQDTSFRLPFLKDSWKGLYRSPPLNGDKF